MESKLEELMQEISTNPERSKQLASVRYYLQDIIRWCQREWLNRSKGITNYNSFLDQIEGWRQRIKVDEVFLVTFNYDTILEFALEGDRRFHFRTAELGNYVSGTYKVIKPHGSINWTHHISQHRVTVGSPEPRNYDELRTVLINSADHLGIDRSIDVGFDYENPSVLSPTIPAIAIPVETKAELECPEEHLQKLWEFLPKVKVMMTVGWRANEKDFVRRLVSGLPSGLKTLVVSSGAHSAEEGADHLRQAGLRGEISGSSASGFTDFEKKVEATRFLRGA